MEAALDLAALTDRVAPLSLARERTLPVHESLAPLFHEGALVRGRTISCQGAAATSTALSLIAPAIAAGAWLAVIDLPTIGLDAACELGVPLERIVAVDTGAIAGATTGRGAAWVDVVAAAADGFDVLLLQVPDGLDAGSMRKLATRLRRREVVAVVLGDPGQMDCDGVLRTDAPRWSGLGDGHGHLRDRQVVVEASGRRLPGQRRCHTAMPAA
ncbi:MAG: hypothetical protein WBP59_17205 [Ilumatobacteraceae bacterium]